eukprot:927677-Rhodomonas_salina.2
MPPDTSFSPMSNRFFTSTEILTCVCAGTRMDEDDTDFATVKQWEQQAHAPSDWAEERWVALLQRAWDPDRGFRRLRHAHSFSRSELLNYLPTHKAVKPKKIEDDSIEDSVNESALEDSVLGEEGAEQTPVKKKEKKEAKVPVYAVLSCALARRCPVLTYAVLRPGGTGVAPVREACAPSRAQQRHRRPRARRGGARGGRRVSAVGARARAWRQRPAGPRVRAVCRGRVRGVRRVCRGRHRGRVRQQDDAAAVLRAALQRDRVRRRPPLGAHHRRHRRARSQRSIPTHLDRPEPRKIRARAPVPCPERCKSCSDTVPAQGSSKYGTRSTWTPSRFSTASMGRASARSVSGARTTSSPSAQTLSTP